MWGWSKHHAERATVASWTSWRTRTPKPTVTDPQPWAETTQPETHATAPEAGRTEAAAELAGFESLEPVDADIDADAYRVTTAATPVGMAMSTGGGASVDIAMPTGYRMSDDGNRAAAPPNPVGPVPGAASLRCLRPDIRGDDRTVPSRRRLQVLRLAGSARYRAE